MDTEYLGTDKNAEPVGTLMEFRLLGPLEVRHRDAVVSLTASMQRAVLASLACRCGSAVSIGVIAADLWGDDLPNSATATIRNYVRHLRRALPAPVIRSVPGGYLLDAAREQVDSDRFDTLITAARATQSDETFRQALSLWRGEPLSDLGFVPLRATFAARWEETYLGALEDHLELRLAQGDHTATVPVLTELAAKFPLRERVNEHLMTALYAGGRAADALAVYRETRTRLATDLGMAPGPRLRDLEVAILRGDPVLTGQRSTTIDSAGSASTPNDLPSLPAHFVGRREETADVAARFSKHLGTGPGRCYVYGPGGSGKSTLVARVGHLVADHHPDGQLYVDLGGSTPGRAPMAPENVMDHLLRRLGGSDTMPDRTADELIRALRVRLRGRRLLIVLDNAASATQIRLVRAAADNCSLLVTSRAPLLDVDADELFHLDALNNSDAEELLTRIVGTRRVRAEPEAARQLVDLCGRLPLALRIIASRIASEPYWSLHEWSELLTDEHHRLSHLDYRDMSVRASLMLGLDGLRTSTDPSSTDALTLFPLVGYLRAPYVTVALASALTGWSLDRARHALDRLSEVQAIYSPTRDRYRPFDLVALLAIEHASAVPDDERDQALRRAGDWYLRAARRAARLVTGSAIELGLPQHHRVDDLDDTGAAEAVEFASIGDVMNWLNQELPVVVGLMRSLVRVDPVTAGLLVRDLLVSLQFYFTTARAWTERAALATLLITVAAGHAAIGYASLAIVEAQRGRPDVALELTAQARRGDLDTYARLTIESLEGTIRALQNKYTDAAQQLAAVVPEARAHGYGNIESRALCNLGDVYVRDGRALEALPVLEEALELDRVNGHRLKEATVANTLLQAYSVLGRHHDVIARSAEVLELHDAIGNSHERAEHLLTVAASYQALGDHESADTHVALARQNFTDISHRERVPVDVLLHQLMSEMP